MPKQNTASVYELRTLCNQNGLSCRDSNGKYLPKSKLIKLLQTQTGGEGELIMNPNLYYETDGTPKLDEKLIAPVKNKGDINDEFDTLKKDCPCISTKTSGSRHHPAQCYVSQTALRWGTMGFDDLMTESCRTRTSSKNGIAQDGRGKRWYRICADGDPNCNLPGHPAGSKPEKISRYGLGEEMQYYEDTKAKAEGQPVD